jgi:leucyl aminopeptidase (aminopeptidase T)
VKSYSTLIKGARLVVETCFAVQKGDAVLVICDEDHRREAEAMAGVAFSLGAYPVITDVSHHVSSALASMDVPMEPAKNVAAAMKASDVIIVTTNLEWANRFAHVNPVAESVALGAKIGSVEEGMADWNLSIDDIDQTMARAERIMAAMAGCEWARVTTPAGTDVRIFLRGRPPLRVVPIKGAGEMMGPVPLWGEVAYAATEDRTEGVIVVDGIMLGVGVYGSLKEPIRWRVEHGHAVEISGGTEAERLRDVIAGSDENADIVAEFAIGTSTKEVLGSPSEKGLLGTVHFALGDNAHCYPGGQSHSRLHLDGSCRQVTIEVDGRNIICDGAFVDDVVGVR